MYYCEFFDNGKRKRICLGGQGKDECIEGIVGSLKS